MFALRDETEDVEFSTNETKYRSDNSTLSFYNTYTFLFDKYFL